MCIGTNILEQLDVFSKTGLGGSKLLRNVCTYVPACTTSSACSPVTGFYSGIFRRNKKKAFNFSFMKNLW